MNTTIPTERTVESRCPECRKPVKLHYALEPIANFIVSGAGMNSKVRPLSESEVRDWRRRGFSVTSTEDEPWFRWSLVGEFPICPPCFRLIEMRKVAA